MNIEQPLVSVLMTAYNRQSFIAEAIESVLASTYTNFELIIVDDCSTDNTVNIANEYAIKDSRVKVYVNEKNVGQFNNRNRAATLAKGKYIKYLDSDDTILEFGVAYCVENMEKFPEAGMGLYAEPTYTNEEAYCMPSEKIIREHFFTKQKLSVGPTGTIINRKMFEKFGFFDGQYGVPSDMFFNIKFAASSPIVLLPKMFVFYRRHDGQEINNQMDYLQYGYLYQKELFTNTYLPLKNSEVNYLYSKLQKRHAVNLIKYFFKTKSFIKTNLVVKKTTFTWLKIITSLFN